MTTDPTHKIMSDLAVIDKRIDRLIDDHTLYRALLEDALERLEASQPPEGGATAELVGRIRKALGK